MAVHTELTAAEAADRLALRELFDAYAHCADRRDAEGQKALFTEDTRFAVYMDGEASEPTYVLEGREALTPVFDDLNRYEATTHFNGQSTVTIDGNRATGESYTIAHHVYTEGGTRKIMIASLRYLDTFTKIDQSWYFAERNLILDWSETRLLGTERRTDGTATELRQGHPAALQGSRHPIDAVRLRPGVVRGRTRENAEAIYAALAAGQMPCDAAWADENVRRFRSWLDTGALP